MRVTHKQLSEREMKKQLPIRPLFLSFLEIYFNLQVLFGSLRSALLSQLVNIFSLIIVADDESQFHRIICLFCLHFILTLTPRCTRQTKSFFSYFVLICFVCVPNNRIFDFLPFHWTIKLFMVVSRTTSMWQQYEVILSFS